MERLKEHANESMQKSERNLGIDLLRILCMGLIVLRHCLGGGGITRNVERGCGRNLGPVEV